MNPFKSSPTYTKRQLTDLLISKVRNLKLLPSVAAEAIEVADRPDAKLQEFADLISRDSKLTIRLLKLANSPLYPSYPGNKPLSCVHSAVMRLGFRQTKQMILVASYSDMVARMDWQERRIREVLKEHAFMTATLASRLDRLFETEMRGVAFTAGLLHDIGRQLLAVTIPEEFSDIDPLIGLESGDVLQREQASIETDHCEVGAWFLRRNQIPEELVSVVEYHHRPDQAFRYTRLVTLVAIADAMANHYQVNRLSKSISSDDAPAVTLLESLGVHDAVFRFDEACNSLLVEAVNDYQAVSNVRLKANAS